jgi:hypothetical protein
LYPEGHSRSGFLRLLVSCLLAGMTYLLSQAQNEPAFHPADTFIHADSLVPLPTARMQRDTSYISHHDPRKAVIYSLILPGLGQIYNRKYWKIPFIYGGAGAFLYYVSYNQMQYRKFRNALFENKATNADAVIDGYSYKFSDLDNGRDYFRRYRDISIAGLAGMYLLNVIDAMVDAYFVRYDITDDLSLKLEPAVIQNTGIMGETASLGFRINIGF